MLYKRLVHENIFISGDISFAAPLRYSNSSNSEEIQKHFFSQEILGDKNHMVCKNNQSLEYK